jgi:rod shape determining protein RodA
MAVGITALIFWQTMINIAMVTGMFPVVGMPLPLISYGGSSILTIFLGLGILLNISMRRFMKE